MDTGESADSPASFDYIDALKNDPKLEFVDHYSQQVARNLRILAARLNGSTLDEIGATHSITRERVRQIILETCGDELENLRSKSRSARESSFESKIREIESFVKGRPGITFEELVVNFGIESSTLKIRLKKETKKLVLGQRQQLRIPQIWSNDGILDSLRMAQTYFHPLRIADFQHLIDTGEIKAPSVPLIIKRFSSWSNACKEAGVEYVESTTSYTQLWSRDDLVEILGSFLTEVPGTGTIREYDDWRNSQADRIPSSAQLRLIVGNWSLACEEALARVRASTWDTDA